MIAWQRGGATPLRCARMTGGDTLQHTSNWTTSNHKNYFPHSTCLYRCWNRVPFQDFKTNSKQHFKPSRTITTFQLMSSKAQQKEGLINVYKFTAMFRQGFTCCEKRRLALKAAIIQGILTRWALCRPTRHVWQLNSQQQFNLNRQEAATRRGEEEVNVWSANDLTETAKFSLRY